MGYGDKVPRGRPRNTFKRDYIFYAGGGLGGGATAILAPSNRHTFWVDHNRFATLIRRLETENISFELYASLTGAVPTVGSEKPVWIDISQSNDRPDQEIKDSVNLSVDNALYIDPAVQQPPYFINTNFITQPADANYQNDQGRWVYAAYDGNGFGLGNSSKVVQSFIPQSPLVTAVWLARLYRSGSLADVTKYHDIIVEIWDTNKVLLGTATISKLAHQLDAVDNNVEYYTNIGGTDYWIDLDEVRVRFGQGIAVTPGALHYICIKQDASTVAHDCAVGSNLKSETGLYGKSDGKERYLFGQAYTAPYASTTLTSIDTTASVCFISQRNIGRTAITFLWDSPAYWYDPASVTDQFRFIKEDFDQVI